MSDAARWSVSDARKPTRDLAELFGNKFLLGNGFVGVRGTLDEYGQAEKAACIPTGLYDQQPGKWRKAVNLPNLLFDAGVDRRQGAPRRPHRDGAVTCSSWISAARWRPRRRHSCRTRRTPPRPSRSRPSGSHRCSTPICSVRSARSRRRRAWRSRSPSASTGRCGTSTGRTSARIAWRATRTRARSSRRLSRKGRPSSPLA